jgi:Ca2+/Na+ antiporter
MLNFIIILLTFYGLGVVVDVFLVPAVYTLKSIFKWTDDQTGTIISFVSSAPELSVSAVALFLAASTGDVRQASMGPGTVIGSALFSILFIVGASAWYNTKKLSWPSVIRDMAYYLLSVLAVYFVVADSKVTLMESSGLLLVFAVYTIIVSQWKKVLRWIDNNIDSNVIGDEKEARGEFLKELDDTEEEKLSIQKEKWTLSNGVAKILSKLFFDLSSHKKINIIKVFWNIGLSIVGVIFFSTVMVNSATILAQGLGISPVVISLTVLAVGTSVPDLLASLKTAREGYGDTAIANAVGSNIFDILANLGLTWLIGSLVTGGQTLSVDTNNLNSSIALLIAATASLVLVMIGKKFHLGKIVSMVLMSSYVLYVAYEVLKATGKI